MQTPTHLFICCRPFSLMIADLTAQSCERHDQRPTLATTLALHPADFLLNSLQICLSAFMPMLVCCAAAPTRSCPSRRCCRCPMCSFGRVRRLRRPTRQKQDSRTSMVSLLSPTLGMSPQILLLHLGCTTEMPRIAFNGCILFVVVLCDLLH